MTHKPYQTTPSTKPEQTAAHGRLTARITEVLDQGRPVRCLDPVRADDWLAEDHPTKLRAAAACQSCPVLTDCFLYSTTWAEPGAVWGGKTPKQRTTYGATGQAELDLDAALAHALQTV